MDLTAILQAAESGDSEARARVIQAAYDDLRKLAAAKMADERQNHTLTSTALVNEVSLRMLNDAQLPTANRGQFFRYVSRAMRNLLIDHARKRGSQKRGADGKKFSFEEVMIACDEQSDDLLALNEALEGLSEFDERKASVVEMRYFGGMSNEDVAAALNISVATVKRDWDLAKGWLFQRLSDDQSTADSSRVQQ